MNTRRARLIRAGIRMARLEAESGWRIRFDSNNKITALAASITRSRLLAREARP